MIQEMRMFEIYIVVSPFSHESRAFKHSVTQYDNNDKVHWLPVLIFDRYHFKRAVI